MLSGRIVKALSGFYYVKTDIGLISCKARGRFRLDGTSPLVGDWVQCQTDNDGYGRIDHVENRRNWFIRPAVSNLDTLVFVAAGVNPVTDPYLIDRVSVIASEADCELIICVNKSDLPPAADEAFKICESAGYQVLHVSAQTGAGVDALRRELSGHITCFAGPSGVGKSSLLNAIEPGLSLQTGHVSEKIKRGRHTTRVAELLPFAGGYIVDTPGFSSMELDGIDKLLLPSYFPEFRPYLGHCRFSPCSHSHEPDCAVKDAVAAGSIPQERYDAYLSILEEIHDNQKKY